MPRAKKVAAKTAAAATKTTTPPRARVEPKNVPKLVTQDSGNVMVTVPKGFTLMLDDQSKVSYDAGTQSMPRAHFEHQYAKDNGVVLFKA